MKPKYNYIVELTENIEVTADTTNEAYDKVSKLRPHATITSVVLISINEPSTREEE